MKKNKVMMAAFAVGVNVFTAQAVINDTDLIPVTNYSWLQLRDGYKPFVGGTAINKDFEFDNNYSGHGPMWMFLNGLQSWSPTGALTGSGNGDYWAGILFTQPRTVDKVKLMIRANEGVSVVRYTIEGSTDGVAFVPIGSEDFGSFLTGNPIERVVAVTENSYLAIRVRFNGTDSTGNDPDYTFGNSGRAGPGLWCIEPYGNDDITASEINVANVNFFTTATSYVADKTFGGYNNGIIAQRTGDGVGVHLEGNYEGSGRPAGWPEGMYIQMDLGEPQRLHCMKFFNAIEGWQRPTDDWTFEYSNDNVTYARIPYTIGITNLVSDWQRHMPIAFQFEPVEARYWRVTGADATSRAVYFMQWLCYQTSRPAPAISAHDLSVTIGELGRIVITPEDIDAEASSGTGAPLTRTLSKSSFYLGDVGKTFSVAYMVSDGVVFSSTNINVTVNLDPAVEGKLPMYDYNWLQLPSGQVQTGAYLVNDDLTLGNPLGNGYGSVGLLRWGGRAWMPASGGNGSGTGSGTSNYCVTVTFDKPRHVYNVLNQWHLENTMSVSKFYVDGMDTNGIWSTIGTNEQSFGVIQFFTTWTPVVAGDYKAVRTRLMAGDYNPGTYSAYGGPGFYSMQPIGAGTLEEWEVNWANGPNFATVATMVGGQYRNATLNSGFFTDFDTNTRYGRDNRRNDYAWETYPADYVEMDLIEPRWFNKLTILWAGYGYSASAIRVLVSEDGVVFTEPEQLSFTHAAPPPQGGFMSSEMTFAPMKMRYVRLADPLAHRGINEGVYIKQMLIMGCKDATPKGTLILVR